MPSSQRNELIVHPNRSAGSPTSVLYLEPMAEAASSPSAKTSPFEIWRIVRKNLVWVSVVVLLGSLAGFALSLAQTPVYTAHVTLEIQNPSEAANVKIGDEAEIAPESYLPTQVAILESRTLKRHALGRLKNETFPIGGTTPSRFDGLRHLLKIGQKIEAASSSEPKTFPTAEVNVSVSANTRIVTIETDSTSSQFASAYANALANEYIDSNLQARWDAINTARQWLSQQLEDTRQKLQASEDQLQAYGRASNLMFTGDKESAEQDKLKDIQGALSGAEADRIAKESAYRTAISSSPDSVPEVLDNARVSEYQSELADLQRQLAQLSAQYTPEHPKVKQIQAQIEQLQQSFQQKRSDILGRIRNDYQSALMKERMLASAYKEQAQIVSEQTQKSVNYGILERDVETNRTMYDTLLQKAHEADIATALRGSNARIIDSAEPPVGPSKPNFVWNTLLGSISGMLAGLGLIFVRESMDRSFKSPGDVSLHLNLPELGAIPKGNLLLGNTAGKLPKGDQFEVDLGLNPKFPHAPDDFERVAWHDKSSVIAESFRNAVTSILHSAGNGTAPRVILVSSAIHAEGKTTVVSNLGISLAEINQKVLLIDGDMRKPRLNEVFSVPNDWGLSDLLREKSSLRDCPLEALVRPTEMPGLSILTSGPATTSISNLLYSHRMLELLQRVRSEFDIILIDTPPMLDIADARILGRLVDAAILVFRAGKTSRDAAEAATRRLTDDGIPVLGTILNAWDVKSTGGYGYSPYSYYTNE